MPGFRAGGYFEEKSARGWIFWGLGSLKKFTSALLSSSLSLLPSLSLLCAVADPLRQFLLARRLLLLLLPPPPQLLPTEEEGIDK
jgi:hypothetical protein